MKKILLFILLFSSSFIYSQSDLVITPEDTLRIHPLGDSITRGAEGDTYRRYLKLKLKQEAHINIDFVGQCPHAADYMSDWANYQDLYDVMDGDIEHDGWGGLTIQQLTDMTTNTRGYPQVTVEDLIDDSPSDIILLMIGTNNEFFKQYSEGAEDALATLIGRIVDTTNTHLIVSTIPPTDTVVMTWTTPRIRKFNAVVPTIVDSFITLGKNISFIDIHGYMDSQNDLLSDYCHPNSQGCEHIADGWYDAITTVVTGVSDKKKSDLPQNFRLMQNYPNPFNPETNIQFSLPKSSHVNISIYDALSREIAVLVNEAKPTGTYEVTFNAGDLSSGIYYCKMSTDKYVEVKKMLLVK